MSQEQERLDQERLEQEMTEQARLAQEMNEQLILNQEMEERDRLERERLEQERAFLEQEMIDGSFGQNEPFDAVAESVLDDHEFDDIETDRPPTDEERERAMLDGGFEIFINGAGELEMDSQNGKKGSVADDSLNDTNQVPLSAYEDFDVSDERYIDEQFSVGAGFVNDDENVFNASEAYKEYGRRDLNVTDQEVLSPSGDEPIVSLAENTPINDTEKQSVKPSGKLISPSERNAIEERISNYNEISDVELASILDSEIGKDRTDKFFSTVDKYLKENPEKSSAIPIDFVLKRLNYLSGKTFGANKSTSFEGLGEKSLNISDESDVSLKPEEKSSDNAVSKTKNESQMTKGEVDASRRANGQGADANNGRGSFLSFNFGKSPTVQSLVGADSVMKPTDTLNKNYSADARLKYTEALNNDMKSFYDLSSAVEKNNTPKNRRELSRAIQSMNQSLDKGAELLSDPSSFKDKQFLKELFNNTRAVGKKLGDLKKAKVIGDDDLSFKALMEKISTLITKTLSMVAGKLGVKLGNEKGADNGMSM